MTKLLSPLFLFLAHAKRRKLIRKLQFVKIENEILRSRLPKRIILTAAERQRLIKFGSPLGATIKELITIVCPRTFARWLAESKKGFIPCKRGRPRIAVDVRELILRIANENHWGYTRILGELKKLGIFRIGRTTVQNLLKENGLDPSPERSRGTWDQFIKRHADTLWACDFVSRKIWTIHGRVDYFLLFFIHIETRQVWVSPTTAHPNSQWVAQQARNFSIHLQENGQTITHLLRDRDTKFTEQFDTIIKTAGAFSGKSSGGKLAKICKLPFRSPNLNAFAERWAQTLQVECLDHFIIFGPSHLDYLTDQFVSYYNNFRPHQSKDNLPLGRDKTQSPPPVIGKIVCQQHLGGLLKHYYRQAA